MRFIFMWHIKFIVIFFLLAKNSLTLNENNEFLPVSKKVIARHTFEICLAIFSPDNKLILTTAKDNFAKIWDAQSGKLLQTLKGHYEPIRFAAFSLNAEYIVTGSEGVLKLWNGKNGRLLRSTDGFDDLVLVSFNNDSSSIFTVFLQHLFIEWDIKSGQVKKRYEWPWLTIVSASISSDEKSIALSDIDGTVKIYNMQDGVTFFELLNFQQHQAEKVMFSPDAKLIATIGHHDVKIWDLKSRQEILTLKGYAFASLVAFSPDGQFIAIITNCAIKIWSLKNGQIISSLEENNLRPNSISFSFDSRQIIVGFCEEIVKVYELPTEELRDPTTLKTMIYTRFIKEFILEAIESERTYINFLSFINNKYGRNIEGNGWENIIFQSMTKETQDYLRGLIPGRMDDEIFVNDLGIIDKIYKWLESWSLSNLGYLISH